MAVPESTTVPGEENNNGDTFNLFVPTVIPTSLTKYKGAGFCSRGVNFREEDEDFACFPNNRYPLLGFCGVGRQ